MTVVELKEKLISEISNTENEVLLEDILQIIDFEKGVADIHIMSDGEIEAVNDGIRQIEAGKSVSHEEIKRQTAEWLKK